MKLARELLRSLTAPIVVFLLHWAGLWAMAEYRLLDLVLSPGGATIPATAAAAAFLWLRMFVHLLLPGWVLVRVWGVVRSREST